jgi:hypothetical protein
MSVTLALLVKVLAILADSTIPTETQRHNGAIKAIRTDGGLIPDLRLAHAMVNAIKAEKYQDVFGDGSVFRILI